MDTLDLVETTPGNYSLLMEAGSTPVDAVVASLGHEPHGYFWAGIARVLVSAEQPALEGRVRYDPEAGMFCAYGTDRDALEALWKLLSPVTRDAERVRKAVDLATAKGVDLD